VYVDVPGAASNSPKNSHLRTVETADAPVRCADSSVIVFASGVAATLIVLPSITKRSPIVTSVFAAPFAEVTDVAPALTVHVPVSVDCHAAEDGQIETFKEFPVTPGNFPIHGPTSNDAVQDMHHRF
jgi:hypothetical protein